jgi:hypothetical protein
VDQIFCNISNVVGKLLEWVGNQQDAERRNHSDFKSSMVQLIVRYSRPRTYEGQTSISMRLQRKHLKNNSAGNCHVTSSKTKTNTTRRIPITL